MKSSRVFSLLILVACTFAATAAVAADSTPSSANKERELIAVLQSGAPPAEKAITCKRLVIYGSDACIPVLAPLLLDPDLASWARIPLEVIPGPAADAALRQALDKAHGLLLVGIINSVAVRRDAKAVPQLATQLQSSDLQVASAAGVALGKIGGDQAAKVLKGSLAKASADLRGAVAEGCIRCAEHYLADGKAKQAVQLYDAVRKADVPRQNLLEATRGAILARKSAGVSLLVEQLRSTDKSYFALGLTTARELPGSQATKAVEAELHRATPERQPLLLLALAGRDDPAAFPTILEAAKTGSKKLRGTAVTILDGMGKPASAPVLLEVAAGDDPELSAAAIAALARISGTEIDKEILARVQHSTGREQQAAIEVAGRRRIEAALPSIVGCAGASDRGTRSSAVQALADLGGEPQIAELVGLLQKTTDAKDRGQLETALLSICGRVGPASSRSLQPLATSDDPSLRIVGLHALAAAGGAEGLKLVAAATMDKDESVQDEAVRTLANWPNTWPEDEAVTAPLLIVARSDTKLSHQVLASRGYLQFLEGDKKLPSSDKLAKVREILPLIKRPEEKQLVIAVVHGAPGSDGLAMLVAFAAEESVAEDACSAIVDMAAKDVPGVSTQERQKGLQTVLEKSTSDKTKRKAEAALKKIQ